LDRAASRAALPGAGMGAVLALLLMGPLLGIAVGLPTPP
jgi:hypothetical protein